MLPPFLYGSYARYKNDTESVARWLVDAARKGGYTEEFLQVKKSKKEKKAASDVKRYKVPLKELILLAQKVDTSATPIPPNIAQAVKRSVALRRRCNGWFKEGGASEIEDDSHAPFIETIDEISRILAVETTLKSQTNGGNADSKMIEDLSSLKLYDSKKTAASHEAVYEIDEGESEESVLIFLHAYCLFEDLNNMRQFISQTWTEYQQGKTDLMNTAIVTDTAIQLARQLSDELISLWPQFQEESLLQKFIFAVACQISGKPGDHFPDETIPYNIELADAANWCYLPTFILLSSFEDVLQPGNIPIYKKGHFGTYEQKADRSAMTDSQKFHEDKLIMLQLLPDFCLLPTLKLKLPVEDEITRGITEFIETKKIPLWLSFATQILLDIHHLQRGNSEKAFGDFRLSALRGKRTIEDYWKLSTSMPTPVFWPKEGEIFIKEIEMTLDVWVINDPISEFKTTVLPGNRRHEAEKHEFLRQHPLLSGLMMVHQNLKMQQVGINIINQWNDVVSLAFLYNLALQTDTDKFAWPDMDKLIQMHGEQGIFLGARPTNVEASFKKLQVVTGVASAKTFAQDSKNQKEWKSQAEGKFRPLEPPTPVANVFRDRYCARAESPLNHQFEKLLHKTLKQSSTSSKSTDQKQLYVSSLLAPKWTATHHLGPLQLLTLIKDALYTEEPLVMYNYFGMHRRSIEILRHIRAQEHQTFVTKFRDEYLPNETSIAGLILYIHHIEQADAENGIVKRVGEVLAEYLGKNGAGEVACKEIRAFCKNKGGEDVGEERKESTAKWVCVEEMARGL